MRKIILTLLAFLFISTLAYADESQYCATPPFLSNVVPPNVLIVQDVSGSMSWSAYNPDSSYSGYCGDDGQSCPNKYDSTQTYEGYFDPSQVYAYDSNNRFWYQVGPTASNSYAACPSSLYTYTCYWWGCYINFNFNFNNFSNNQYSGNCLNFLVMSRSDLSKWALTGGEPAACASGNNYSNIQCDATQATQTTAHNYTGVVLEPSQSNQFNVLVPMSRIQSAVLPTLSQYNLKPRIGLEMFTTNSQGNTPYVLKNKVYIGDYTSNSQGNLGNADPSHPYTNLIQYLNYQQPEYGTPTGPALQDAMAYFQQQPAPFSYGFSTGVGTAKDPLYICDYQGNNCQAAPCAQNFIILMSDGGWNAPDCTTSSDPARVAYQMHTQNLRSFSGYTGNININKVYTVYLGNLGNGGNASSSGAIYGQQAMENIAMYGSFNYNPNNQQWPDSLAGYPNGTCTDMTDCGGQAYGSLCTPLPACSQDWCSNTQTGLPDTFFNISNASSLKSSLLSAFYSIMKQAASATSASPSTQQTQQGSSLIQALFYPQKTFDNNTQATWIGYLYDWWLYTPIGSNSASILNANTGNVLDPTQDYTLQFVFQNNQMQAQEYLNGQLVNTVPIDQLSPVWEAGKILWNTPPNQRTIYTTDGTNLIPFNISSLSQFQSYLGNLSGLTYLNGPLSPTPSCQTDSGYTNTPVDNLVEYIKGCDLAGARNRTVTIGGNTNVWKLGDIIYSTPQIWQYTNYAQPSQNYSVVYVASNDGMLHAFLLGDVQKTGLSGAQVAKLCDSANGCTTSQLGHELWAFIPKDALPYLRYLPDPNYCHIYLNDLTPYIFTANGHVILIGGMRMGGASTPYSSNWSSSSDTIPAPSSTSPTGLSAYYALDITNPTQPKFLWEFTNPNLGFSFSGPALIKINNNYYVMFLSGPTDYSGDSNQNLSAFILTLNSSFGIQSTYTYTFGNNYKYSFGGRLFTQGITDPNTGNTIAIPFGVSIEKNLNNTQNWTGDVILMLTNGSTDPSQWTFQTIFNAGLANPVTAKVVSGSCFNNTYLYFGTGKYFTNNDNYNCPNSNGCTADNLYGVNITSCLTNSKNCQINSANQNTTPSKVCGELQSPGNNLPSWQIPLNTNDPGYLKERDISDPTFTGQNMVIFTTMEPTNSLCGYGGRSRLWGFNCATGGAISDTTCPGYVVSNPQGTIFLQTSTGTITQMLPSNAFTQQSNTATPWQQGTPPETSAPLVKPYTARTGIIIQWLEQ